MGRAVWEVLFQTVVLAIAKKINYKREWIRMRTLTIEKDCSVEKRNRKQYESVEITVVFLASDDIITESVTDNGENLKPMNPNWGLFD